MFEIHTMNYKKFPSAFQPLQESAVSLSRSWEDSSKLDNFPADRFSYEALQNEISLKMEEMYKHFSTTLLKEAAKGNFEVLRLSEIWVFFRAPEVISLVAQSPLRRSIFEAICNVSIDHQGIQHLQECINAWSFRMDRSLALIFWKKFKECLEVEARGMHPVSYEARNTLDTLFKFNLLDEEDATEVSTLIFENRHSHTLSNLQSKVSFDFSPEKIRFPLRFNAIAPFVATYNPSFYLEQLAARGIDSATASILIDSWEGDFTSFLDAAESLSAEKLL